MARDKAKSYRAWLDREGFEIDASMSADDIKAALAELWKQKHDTSRGQPIATQKQLDALSGVAIERQLESQIEQASDRSQDYYQTSGGRTLPKLASRGIRRITYDTAHGRVTRYVIPGHKGLYGLQRARAIFPQL